ncbi:MAG TPA: NAD-dependent epimerase/dehydratase family protein [Solirubrobacterales bacterium]|nr:NAD-dependent epimerase/dehydratase family protein [Solirubrobacterales bacterium]
MGAQEPSGSFWQGKSVVVTGGAGFLGKPTVRMLSELGAEVRVPRSAEHDLTEPAACREALNGAEVVLHLAANVGGIGYNRRNPGPLVRDNMAMGLNVFEACRELGVSKLVAACSVCAYPKFTPVPFKEDDLWSGFPEESNAPYGLAKKMLIVLSDSYRRQYGLDSCVPVIANLYGPDDNFDLEDSHVIAAMVHKYVVAADEGQPQVVLWGTGEPSREFLYVDDAARALLLAAEHADSSEPFNVGTGIETKIRDLAAMVAEATGFQGETVWDTSRPDGQPVRYLDVTRAEEAIGFRTRTDLAEGLKQTVASFRASPARV